MNELENLQAKQRQLIDKLGNNKIRQFYKFGLGDELSDVRRKIEYLKAPWYKKIFIKLFN